MLRLVLAVLCVLSVALLGLMIAGKFVEFDAINYAYALGAEIILPIEYLFYGNITYVSAEMASTIIIALSAALLFISILGLIGTAQLFKDDKYFASTTFFIISEFTTLAITVLYGYSIVITRFNYSVFTNFLNTNSPEILKQLAQSAGSSIVLSKALILSIMTFIICLYGFITLMVKNPYLTFKRKGGRRIRTASSLYFYSNEYQEQKDDVKIHKSDDGGGIEIVENIKESNEKAQELVKKVMQLNELKEQGQITEREYTKLRQKAIKRYKAWESFLENLRHLFQEETF